MTKEKPPVTATTVWQEWAKKRAKNALPLERVHEISKKVKVNVTRRLLEERRNRMANVKSREVTAILAALYPFFVT